MTTSANDLNAQIVQIGNARGGYLWRNNTGAWRGNGRMIHYGHKGSGDVIGCYHGYFISIETKTPTDIASKEQIQFVIDIKGRGGFACFARDVDDAIEFFDMIDKREAERNGAQVIPF